VLYSRYRRAFTLIEAAITLVVIAIIATVVAFAGAALINRGRDDATTHALLTASASAQAFYTSRGVWPTVSQFSQTNTVDSAYSFVDGSSYGAVSTGPSIISTTTTAPHGMLYMASYDPNTGTCFWLEVNPPNVQGSDIRLKKVVASSSCIAYTTPVGTATW